MTNIYDYVKKYGKYTYEELEFNDLDNLVFSLLTYLDYGKTKVKENTHTIKEIGKYYLKTNSYKKVAHTGIAQKRAYKLLELVIYTKRYGNVILSNYEYLSNKEMQFGVITFNISKKLKVIAFEGTDELISGWKEDLFIASTFPIPSHIETIKYIKKNIKITGPKVIICGHSKGGNLALIAGMFTPFYKRFKIQKLYNNDGPGLRTKEYKTIKYKTIKKKYIHIVPNHSIVGVLLHNDNYKVIKSKKKGILAHDLYTWQTNETSIEKSELSEKSKTIEKNILKFINSHKDEQLLNGTNKLFKILEDENISDTMKLTKVKNLIKISHKFIKLDKETKDLIIELIFYTYNLQREK